MVVTFIFNVQLNFIFIEMLNANIFKSFAMFSQKRVIFQVIKS